MDGAVEGGGEEGDGLRGKGGGDAAPGAVTFGTVTRKTGPGGVFCAADMECSKGEDVRVVGVV